jgi:multiple sugar transport system permease protein
MNTAKIKDRAATVIIYILFFIVLVLIGFPLYWLVITSLKPPLEWTVEPPTFWPRRFYIESFQQLLASAEVLMALLNSFIVSVLATALSAFVGSITAYSLVRARLRFNFNRVMMVWILVARVIPPVTILLPYFMIIRKLGLMDTRLALILTDTYLVFPFVVWMMISFFQGIDKEIDEAAIIDGCPYGKRFFLIGLPLSKTGLVVTAVFVFLGVWNEFLFALTLTSVRAQTFPLLLGKYMTDLGYQWGFMMALSLIGIGPVLLFSIFSQRSLIRGLTLGAVKE